MSLSSSLPIKWWFNSYFSKFYIFIFFWTSSTYAQRGLHSEYDKTIERIYKTLTYETKDNIDSLNTILKQSNNVCIQTLAIYHDAAIYYLLKNELGNSERKSLECIERAEKNKSKMDYSCYESIIRMSATRLFYVYRRKGEYNKALDIIVKHKHAINILEFQSLVGINEFDLGNYLKAIEKFEIYLQTVKTIKEDSVKNDFRLIKLHKIRDLARIANIHNFIADAFVQQYKKTQKIVWLDSANLPTQD